MFSRVTAIPIFTMAIMVLFCTISGCMSVRTSDTHNTTIALQEYNTWAAEQKLFDREIRSDLQRISADTTSYNAEIVRENPDLTLIRKNTGDEKQLVNGWTNELAKLSLATDSFERNTSGLTYGNDHQTRQQLALMIQYMRIYAISIGNAQQHLIDYTNNEGMYFGSENPDYWNDGDLQAALNARQLAASSLSEGDVALGNLTSQAQILQQSQ
jgi:hypothetical protein